MFFENGGKFQELASSSDAFLSKKLKLLTKSNSGKNTHISK